MENKVYVVTATSIYGPEVDTNVFVFSTFEEAQEKFVELKEDNKQDCEHLGTLIDTPLVYESYDEQSGDMHYLYQILERKVGMN